MSDTGVKPGDRVLAASHLADGVLHVFGEGVYEGDFVPGPEAVGWMAGLLRDAGRTNPRIKLLDTDETVWGAECWWGPAADILAGASAVVTVSITEQRKLYREAEEQDRREQAQTQENTTTTTTQTNDQPSQAQ